jgi:hypothetical protein
MREARIQRATLKQYSRAEGCGAPAARGRRAERRSPRRSLRHLPALPQESDSPLRWWRETVLQRPRCASIGSHMNLKTIRNRNDMDRHPRSKTSSLEGRFQVLHCTHLSGGLKFTLVGECAVKCAIPGAPKCAFKGLSATPLSASVRAYVEGKLLILQWLPPRESHRFKIKEIHSYRGRVSPVISSRNPDSPPGILGFFRGFLRASLDSVRPRV